MPLLSADAAREFLTTAAPVVLDVRWSLATGADRNGYAAAHLPGAVLVDLDGQLCGPPGPGGRHPLPETDALRTVLREAGVGANRPVLIYDGGDMMAAARAWWTLRWAGLTDVRVIDGGFAAWTAIGAPVTDEVVVPEPTDLELTPGSLPVLDGDAAARLARTGTLLDVRAPERFRGEVEPIDPVAGHIPGAVNTVSGQIMAPDGGFRDAAAIRDLFTDLDTADLGVYCGSGVTAARTALALTAAGLGTPPVYIGSWSAWVADPDRPVARAAE